MLSRHDDDCLLGWFFLWLVFYGKQISEKVVIGETLSVFDGFEVDTIFEEDSVMVGEFSILSFNSLLR